MPNERIAACVIGWPIEQSRSPLIHNYWIGKYGISGEYRREAVKPEEFKVFVSELAQKGYVGANVTIPHKEIALELARADDSAKAIGAANTLWFEGEMLCATNTDVEGFLASLDQSALDWDKGLGKAIVLGAGGSARAVVYGLLTRGVKTIYVANRTLERAQVIADRFGEAVKPVTWDEATGLMASAGLLVNTTPLGMRGHSPLDINIDNLPASAVVCDIVYVPLITPLLRQARERGLRTADGLSMLLHQAVRGFSLWFGIKPEVTSDLRTLIENDLTKDDKQPADTEKG